MSTIEVRYGETVAQANAREMGASEAEVRSLAPPPAGSGLAGSFSSGGGGSSEPAPSIQQPGEKLPGESSTEYAYRLHPEEYGGSKGNAEQQRLAQQANLLYSRGGFGDVSQEARARISYGDTWVEEQKAKVRASGGGTEELTYGLLTPGGQITTGTQGFASKVYAGRIKAIAMGDPEGLLTSSKGAGDVREIKKEESMRISPETTVAIERGYAFSPKEIGIASDRDTAQRMSADIKLERERNPPKYYARFEERYQDQTPSPTPMATAPSLTQKMINSSDITRDMFAPTYKASPQDISVARATFEGMSLPQKRAMELGTLLSSKSAEYLWGGISGGKKYSYEDAVVAHMADVTANKKLGIGYALRSYSESVPFIIGSTYLTTRLGTPFFSAAAKGGASSTAMGVGLLGLGVKETYSMYKATAAEEGKGSAGVKILSVGAGFLAGIERISITGDILASESTKVISSTPSPKTAMAQLETQRMIKELPSVEFVKLEQASSVPSTRVGTFGAFGVSTSAPKEASLRVIGLGGEERVLRKTTPSPEEVKAANINVIRDLSAKGLDTFGKQNEIFPKEFIGGEGGVKITKGVLSDTIMGNIMSSSSKGGGRATTDIFGESYHPKKLPQAAKDAGIVTLKSESIGVTRAAELSMKHGTESVLDVGKMATRNIFFMDETFKPVGESVYTKASINRITKGKVSIPELFGRAAKRTSYGMFGEPESIIPSSGIVKGAKAYGTVRAGVYEPYPFESILTRVGKDVYRSRTAIPKTGQVSDMLFKVEKGKVAPASKVDIFALESKGATKTKTSQKLRLMEIEAVAKGHAHNILGTSVLRAKSTRAMKPVSITSQESMQRPKTPTMLSLQRQMVNAEQRRSQRQTLKQIQAQRQQQREGQAQRQAYGLMSMQLPHLRMFDGTKTQERQREKQREWLIPAIGFRQRQAQRQTLKQIQGFEQKQKERTATKLFSPPTFRTPRTPRPPPKMPKPHETPTRQRVPILQNIGLTPKGKRRSSESEGSFFRKLKVNPMASPSEFLVGKGKLKKKQIINEEAWAW